MKPFVVALDGPAGAGKSTTARGVARRLDLPHVDSGAMYRGLAWLALRDGVPLDDERAVADLLARSPLAFESGRLTIGGVEIGDQIRSGEAGEAASRVAVHPRVRVALVAFQRSLARPGGVVMEGRDIGTVVFPQADIKIFVTASPESRAERRYAELLARGEIADRAAIEASVRERDRRDRERAASPLIPARDAYLLDTTNLTPEEQADLAGRWAELARLGPGRMGGIYWFGKEFVATFARLCLDFHVEGLERLPRKGPLIVAANHISFWDPPLIGSILPRNTYFIAKAELFQNRLFAAILRSYNAYPIQRGLQARAGLRGAEEALATGGSVLIFPEGTRSKTGDFLPPRPGIGRLAAVTRTPVAPAYISGSNQIRRSMLRQVPIRITFGSPMMPPRIGGSDREGAREYARRVMDAIAAIRAARE